MNEIDEALTLDAIDALGGRKSESIDEMMNKIHHARLDAERSAEILDRAGEAFHRARDLFNQVTYLIEQMENVIRRAEGERRRADHERRRALEERDRAIAEWGRFRWELERARRLSSDQVAIAVARVNGRKLPAGAIVELTGTSKKQVVQANAVLRYAPAIANLVQTGAEELESAFRVAWNHKRVAMKEPAAAPPSTVG